MISPRAATRLPQRFIRFNHRISSWIEQHLPQSRNHVHDLYERKVAEYMNWRKGQQVLDIGAGKSCHFARLRDSQSDTTIVGFDVSAEEMQPNQDVDQKVVGNAEEHLPFADGSVDLVVSRSVLEHFQRVQPFLEETHRVLCDGGHTIHVFPSRFAPFSILNQLLPRRLSRRILSTLIPGSEGILGFPAYYDHCSPRAMERLLRETGFEIVETRVTYYQSSYYGFFVPMYLLSAFYEFVIHRLGLRNLAATVLIVARKSET